MNGQIAAFDDGLGDIQHPIWHRRLPARGRPRVLCSLGVHIEWSGVTHTISGMSVPGPVRYGPMKGLLGATEVQRDRAHCRGGFG